MKILYDGRVFQFQKAGGINRIFKEVISGLPADYHPIVTGVEDFGVNTPNHPNLKRPRFRLSRLRRLGVPLRERWWKPRLLRQLDLFHPTYYDLIEGFSFSDFKCPIVLTVYDFIYAIYPELTEGSAANIRHQTEAIGRADHIICISQATQNDLLERFPEKQNKTSVVYLGSSFEIQQPLEEQAVYENPFFLFVGGRGGYKNFFFLLRAFAKASEVSPRIRLRVVGAPLTAEERWQIHLLGISDRVEAVVYPEEQKLQELYHSSAALLYPSLHEGFGIPPLEAMACGTIPVTANTTSLPEVVGDGGIMLDPKDEDVWTDCLIKLSRPFPERDKFLEKGRQRVRQFTWTESIRQHLTIYRQLAS
jgi:glycosyltransferase involved in cell wall biosynthesis